jgi:hypothetical protein
VTCLESRALGHSPKVVLFSCPMFQSLGRATPDLAARQPGEVDHHRLACPSPLAAAPEEIELAGGQLTLLHLPGRAGPGGLAHRGHQRHRCAELRTGRHEVIGGRASGGAAARTEPKLQLVRGRTPAAHGIAAGRAHRAQSRDRTCIHRVARDRRVRPLLGQRRVGRKGGNKHGAAQRRLSDRNSHDSPSCWPSSSL